MDGKYVPQGKIGCAVLGSHSAKDVRKLLTFNSHSQCIDMIDFIRSVDIYM